MALRTTKNKAMANAEITKADVAEAPLAATSKARRVHALAVGRATSAARQESTTGAATYSRITHTGVTVRVHVTGRPTVVAAALDVTNGPSDSVHARRVRGRDAAEAMLTGGTKSAPGGAPSPPGATRA